MTPFIILCAAVMVLTLVAIGIGLYIEVRHHRETLAAQRSPGAMAMLALTRQVEALQADVDAMRGANRRVSVGRGAVPQ